MPRPEDAKFQEVNPVKLLPRLSKTGLAVIVGTIALAAVACTSADPTPTTAPTPQPTATQVAAGDTYCNRDPRYASSDRQRNHRRRPRIQRGRTGVAGLLAF